MKRYVIKWESEKPHPRFVDPFTTGVVCFVADGGFSLGIGDDEYVSMFTTRDLAQLFVDDLVKIYKPAHPENFPAEMGKITFSVVEVTI